MTDPFLAGGASGPAPATAAAPAAGSLVGLRVLDPATLFAGPLAAALLGDFGTEVIKIEHPRRPDPSRGRGPAKDGVGLWWKLLGRNKRAMTLDLSRPGGLARSCARGRARGFLGRAAIHPRQLPVVEAAYRPAAEETEAAEIVRAAAARPGALALTDGRFVDPAVVAGAGTGRANGEAPGRPGVNESARRCDRPTALTR